MARLNWDRVRLENRIRRSGTEASEQDSLSPGFAPAGSKGATRSKLSTTSKKTRRNQKAPVSAEQQALNFLHQLISAEVRGAPLPGVPKKIRFIVAPIIEKAGGIEQWMWKHPKYEELRQRSLKKNNKKKQKETKSRAANLAKVAFGIEQQISRKLDTIEAAKAAISQAKRDLELLYEQHAKIAAMDIPTDPQDKQ